MEKPKSKIMAHALSGNISSLRTRDVLGMGAAGGVWGLATFSNDLGCCLGFWSTLRILMSLAVRKDYLSRQHRFLMRKTQALAAERQ